MTVAPSIAVASSTLSAPSKRGTRPATTSAARGGSTNRLVRKPIAMTSSSPVMTRSNTRWPRRSWTSKQQQRNHSGDDAADHQRQVEQQMQRNRSTDDLGEIGCHGDQFGLQPVGDAGRRAGVVGDGLGQRATGDEAELGRQVLHQSGHHVGQHDDPDQQEAVLGAGADVGGDVARVDVGDRGDECRPEEQPASPQRGAVSCAKTLTLLSGHYK